MPPSPAKFSHRARIAALPDKTPTPNGLRDMVLLLGSTGTEEKIRQVQAIGQKQHLPLLALPFDLLNIVTSAKENSGGFDGNALQKEEMTYKTLDQIAPAEKERRLRVLCERMHIRYVPERMFSFVEDGGFGMHPRLWRHMLANPEFTRECPADLLALISKAAYAGPGVETAPVLSAVLGVPHFIAFVQTALDNLKAELIADKTIMANGRIPDEFLQVYENTHLTFTNILDPKITHSKDAMAQHRWHLEGDKLTAHPDPTGATRTSYHYIDYISPKKKKSDGPLVSCASKGDAFLAEHHVRAIALREIWKECSFGHLKHSHESINRDYPLHTGFIGERKAHAITNGTILLKDMPLATTPNPDALPDAVTLLADIQPLIQHNDVLVMMPPGPVQSEADKFRIDYYLDTIMVAKQTEPMHYQKGVLVVDDGSMSDSLAAHQGFIDLGMTKNYVLPWTPARLIGKQPYEDKYEFNQYLNVLKWNKAEYNSQQIGSAVNDWLKYHHTQKNAGAAHYANYDRRGKHEPHDPLAGQPPAGTPKASSLSRLVEQSVQEIRARAGFVEEGDHSVPRMNVAVFCSAGSENASLNDMTAQLTEDLAAKGHGVIYGGADQKMMGRIRQGVLNYRQKHKRPGDNRSDEQIAYIGGVSAPALVKKETLLGKGPENIHYIEVPGLPPRIAIMAQSSDAFIAKPGGAGTKQELDALFYLKALNHSSLKDKPIILINPEVGPGKEGARRCFWDNGLLENMLGKEAAAKVRAPIGRHAVPRHLNDNSMWNNVFIVNNIQEAERLLDRHHRYHHLPQHGLARSA